eukprot:5172947-Alexandrium_andersonii.AAC.1
MVAGDHARGCLGATFARCPVVGTSGVDAMATLGSTCAGRVGPQGCIARAATRKSGFAHHSCKDAWARQQHPPLGTQCACCFWGWGTPCPR